MPKEARRPRAAATESPAIPALPPGCRLDTLAVALLSALPPLLAHAAFGMIATPDTEAYLVYAEAIRTGAVPWGAEVLARGPAPETIYRTPGFPLVLAALQALSPGGWPVWLLALQVAAQSAVAALAHRAALDLGLSRWAALAAALIPVVGYAVVVQVSVLTDALAGALFSAAALLLLRAALAGDGRLGAVALAGAMLGAAALAREATVALALAAAPLAALAAGSGLARRAAGPVLLLAPALAAAFAVAAFNGARTGHAVVSTTRQVVMVQALLPLVAERVPVFAGDAPYDRIAREEVEAKGYAGIGALNWRMFAEHGATAPELARMATDRYLRAWGEHPAEMLLGVAERLPVKLFWSAFMPVDAAADLHRHSGAPRPWFGREGELGRAAMAGSPLAALMLLALSGGRAIGLTMGLAAMLAPVLLRRGDARFWPVLGAWLVCGGLLGVYAPVHIEQRYLVPVVPLVALLGAVGIGAARARLRGRAA